MKTMRGLLSLMIVAGWALPSLAGAQAFPMFSAQEESELLPTQTAQPQAKPAEAEGQAPESPDTEDESLREVREGPDVPFGAYLFRGRFAQESFRGFNPDYIISVGDRINLTMWGAVDLNTQLEVDSQGNIVLPKVGPVQVLNLRNEKLNEVIEQRIREVYRENVGVYAALAMAEPVRVFVAGNVEAPGLYAAHGSDSLLHFLDRAGGIDPESGSYLDIRVLRNGEVKKRLSLYDFLLDGQMPLVQFRDGDTILVGPRKSTVSVTGLVNREARYEFRDAIALSRLLEYAGISERATHVQVIRNQTIQRQAEVVSLRKDELDEIAVVSGDEVNVFEDRRVGAITASVEGEFKGVSQFVLPYEATLGDLLDRIELTNRSNREGIQLFRKSVAARQKEVLDQMLRKLEEAVLSARSGTREEAQLRVAEAELIKAFIERASKVEPKGAIVLHDGVDPDEVALEDGDVLRIPRESNTVAVQGEVFIPTSFIHQEGKSVDYYLEQAGGMTQPGNSDRVYVKRVNGEIAIAQGGLFTRTRVKPGDEIMVLPKVELKTFQFTKDLTQVMSQIALTAGVVLGI
jgi:protein involved in polysaccharide export with SLBB domain